jgi:hypothetical protein
MYSKTRTHIHIHTGAHNNNSPETHTTTHTHTHTHSLTHLLLSDVQLVDVKVHRIETILRIHGPLEFEHAVSDELHAELEHTLEVMLRVEIARVDLVAQQTPATAPATLLISAPPTQNAKGAKLRWPVIPLVELPTSDERTQCASREPWSRQETATATHTTIHSRHTHIHAYRHTDTFIKKHTHTHSLSLIHTLTHLHAYTRKTSPQRKSKTFHNKEEKTTKAEQQVSSQPDETRAVRRIPAGTEHTRKCPSPDRSQQDSHLHPLGSASQCAEKEDLHRSGSSPVVSRSSAALACSSPDYTATEGANQIGGQVGNDMCGVGGRVCDF